MRWRKEKDRVRGDWHVGTSAVGSTEENAMEKLQDPRESIADWFGGDMTLMAGIDFHGCLSLATNQGASFAPLRHDHIRFGDASATVHSRLDRVCFYPLVLHLGQPPTHPRSSTLYWRPISTKDLLGDTKL